LENSERLRFEPKVRYVDGLSEWVAVGAQRVSLPPLAAFVAHEIERPTAATIETMFQRIFGDTSLQSLEAVLA
jgi:hypothetical protein